MEGVFKDVLDFCIFVILKNGISYWRRLECPWQTVPGEMMR